MFDLRQTKEIAQDIAKDVASEHLKITKEWAITFIGVGTIVLVLGTLAGAMATVSAPIWLIAPVLVAFAFSGVIALIVLRSLEYARYCLQTRFDEWQQNQETSREVALMIAQQTNNISVKGKGNVVSVGGNAGAESVRLIPVNSNTPTRFIDGVAEQDLLFFVERMLLQGFSKRAWLGQSLPTGKTVTTFDDYNQLIAPLVKAKVIEGRGERSAGKLTTDDPERIKALLGLPSGASNTVRDITPGEYKHIDS